MKQKKRELMMQERGKYFLDMSKLVFGGIILAGIMNLGMNSELLLGMGLLTVIVFAQLGFCFYSKSK